MNKCSYVNIKEMSGKGKYYEEKLIKSMWTVQTVLIKWRKLPRIQPALKMQQLIS